MRKIALILLALISTVVVNAQAITQTAEWTQLLNALQNENWQEANEYLKHPVLGNRLINICRVLLDHEGKNANRIFGSPDDLKLKSSMTLFASLKDTSPVFKMVLDKFFNGKHDERTLEIIAQTTM